MVIEGDAQNVVKAFQGKLSRGFHSQVMVDNIMKAASRIDQIEFLFCFREANAVAHRLAKRALAGFCSSIWTDGGPS